MTFVDDAGIRRLVALAAEPEVIAGRFELGVLLGEGGMGVVFEAWDREGQRSVALKLLRDVDEAASVRFDREAAALATLSHPGIVGYVAHGSSAQGERYLAMERLEGMTLAARLSAGPLGVQDAARLGHGVASALVAAHRHGLVHRDIKTSNLFLSDGSASRVQLLDFGLARAQDAAAVTRTGALLGTPSYMAPEQVRGSASPDARTDLFALGAVLFECLTGRAPFVSADTEGLLVKILVEQPPAVRELCPSVPPAFEALIARLLAKEPARRPADAAEVARELAALLPAVLPEHSAETAPATAAEQAAQPGSLIAGKYRVVRTIGSGGMGIVLLARHETLERNVAIKLLRGSGNEQSAVARLVREAQAASRLESEHVARVMDVGTLDDGAPFIVMEFLSGKDLGQVLRDSKRLPVGVVVDHVLQACEAIAEAHAVGIVHRDLKPSNLFLTSRRDGSALIKVLDFGISKLFPTSGVELLPSDASITAPDAILGSPLYMSPEQLQSAKRVDARTDIWSLGVVLQELLTGRPPFQADSFLAIGAQIAAGAPVDLRAGCPEAPEGLAVVVRRCLEKDPERRFQSIAALAQALAPYAAAGPAKAARAGHAVPAPPRRRGVILLALATALALGGALFVARRSAPSFASSKLATIPATGAIPSSDVSHDAGPPVAPTTSAAPSSDSPSSVPRPAPSGPSPRRGAPAGEGRRRATPSPARSHSTSEPPAPGALDPMNPALINR